MTTPCSQPQAGLRRAMRALHIIESSASPEGGDLSLPELKQMIRAQCAQALHELRALAISQEPDPSSADGSAALTVHLALREALMERRRVTQTPLTEHGYTQVMLLGLPVPRDPPRDPRRVAHMRDIERLILERVNATITGQRDVAHRLWLRLGDMGVTIDDASKTYCVM